MNKWFASARDISDSEDSESSDEDQQKKQTQQQAQPQAKKTGIAPQKKNYMKNFEESSESEEEQRVVKTQKDKKLEIFNAIKKEINNHVKINDFSSLMTDFERFCEDIERDQASHASVIFESSKDGVLPISVLRIFVKIEDAINDTQNSVKDKKVTLNKTNSVSLNKLK
jgi:translation initiation factor 3 subunit C